MRPSVLFPLFAEVGSLPGVGARLGELMTKVAGPCLIDLLWHLPSGLIDRSFAPPIAAAPADRVATITVRVDAHEPQTRPRRPYRVRCSDKTGSMDLVFFHAKEPYLSKALPVGTRRVVSGRVSRFRDRIEIVHPDHIASEEEHADLARAEPTYSLTSGLTNKTLSKAIRQALKRTPELEEWIDPAFHRARGWRGWRPALEGAHALERESDLSLANPDRQRLAYDELLAHQLALILVRGRLKKRKVRPLRGDGSRRERVYDALPFRLTQSQVSALADIEESLAHDQAMLRLLQGDVGSGKTIVAFLAMLVALEAGCQAALMAPTEILCRQHAEVLGPLAEAAGARVAVLTGSDRGKSREGILDALARGELDMVIGTHALFQEKVRFHDLGLIVIDEQQRFGVHQRLALEEKGRGAHMLIMTATPIPRTLTLAVYGHMECSRLTEKPSGRRPITTRAMPLSRFDGVVAGVRRAIERGGSVYWICPLVIESEASDLAAATERHASLAKILGDQATLVHGQMKAPLRNAAMKAFAEGRARVLVATTVVEVGVDVTTANVIVIEHAERFGLAQLHQLRGRVGRGAESSSCILLYAPPLSGVARERLSILRESEDGFHIAEEDARLRGSGDVLGSRQSGLPDFRLADPLVHHDLLAAAHDDARLIADRDPELTSPRGRRLRSLLYLFQRDEAVRMLRSG